MIAPDVIVLAPTFKAPPAVIAPAPVTVKADPPLIRLVKSLSVPPKLIPLAVPTDVVGAVIETPVCVPPVVIVPRVKAAPVAVAAPAL